jgi:hypothetical protein
MRKMPGMNRLHRFFQPAAASATRSAAPGTAMGMALPGDRASLQGLEVSDSTWDEWVQVQNEVQARRAAASAMAAAPTRARSLQ